MHVLTSYCLPEVATTAAPAVLSGFVPLVRIQMRTSQHTFQFARRNKNNLMSSTQTYRSINLCNNFQKAKSEVETEYQQKLQFRDDSKLRVTNLHLNPGT